MALYFTAGLLFTTIVRKRRGSMELWRWIYNILLGPILVYLMAGWTVAGWLGRKKL